MPASRRSRVTDAPQVLRGPVWLAGDLESCQEIASTLTGLGATNVFTAVEHDALPEGSVMAACGILTTSTWSRLRHGSAGGPQPVRNSSWPWGLPWLTDGDRREVEKSNNQLRNVLAVLQKARDRSPSAVLMFWHPEDLGRAKLGRPSSPWQLREVRRWANREGLHRAALFQCAFNTSSHRLPMAVLFSHPFSHPDLHPGWPIFRGEANDHYIGPLPRKCACPDPQHTRQTTETNRELRRTSGSGILIGTINMILAPMMGLARDAESALLRKGRGQDRLHFSCDEPRIKDPIINHHIDANFAHSSFSSLGSDSSGSEVTLVQEVSDFEYCTGGASDSEGHAGLSWDVDTMNLITIDHPITVASAAGYPQNSEFGEVPGIADEALREAAATLLKIMME